MPNPWIMGPGTASPTAAASTSKRSMRSLASQDGVGVQRTYATSCAGRTGTLLRPYSVLASVQETAGGEGGGGQAGTGLVRQWRGLLGRSHPQNGAGQRAALGQRCASRLRALFVAGVGYAQPRRPKSVQHAQPNRPANSSASAR